MEAEEHNDLVVEDFQESYKNLTVKTTNLLKWLSSSNCSKARFIFKVDDDVHVNPANLWATLRKPHLSTFNMNTTNPSYTNINTTNINYALIGHVWQGSKANRNPFSKYIDHKRSEERGDSLILCRYYLSARLYPHTKLPNFLSGDAYIFSGSLLPLLYSCALR